MDRPGRWRKGDDARGRAPDAVAQAEAPLPGAQRRMGSGERTMGLGLPADGLSPWDVSANYAVALSGYVTNFFSIRS